MKDLRTSRPARIIAFILCVVCLTAAMCCVGPLKWLSYMGADSGYDYYKDRAEEQLLEDQVIPLLDTVEIAYENGNAPEDIDRWVRSHIGDFGSWFAGDPNLFYTVRGEDGRLIASSEVLGEYRARVMQTATVRKVDQVSETYLTAEERDAALQQLDRDYDEVDVNDLTDDPSAEGYPLHATCIRYSGGETITASGFIRAEMEPYGQSWTYLSRAAALFNARPAYQAVIPGGIVLGLLCLAFLLWSTGHEKGRDGIVLSAFDRKAPIDVLLPAGVIAVLLWLATGLDSSGWQAMPDRFPFLRFGLLSLVLAFGLYILLSAVRRIQAGEDQRGNLFFARAGRFCGRGLKKVGGGLDRLAGKLPLFWLAAVVFLAFTFLEGLSVIAIRCGAFLGVFFWFFLKAVEAAGIIWIVLAFRRLQEGGRELAAGNLDYQIPLETLWGPFRSHGEHLNSIRDAIQVNLEERMRSERMKTELITNVSHDIKTPLTSIVSYVGLLKKQEMPTPEAKEYLEVLDRQSARLKKLTEDLVEASKASTGNIPVNLERTDVNVLLAQSAGEYQERLKEKDLTLVLSPSEASPAILADGRLLWRVFDNLLSNIRKYAQPGTRVYLSCEADADRVTILFRNISASPLNISADELLERFVRGDESRSTEGSGLGLSIAQDLTRLQGGTFDLAIDGDLFKVRLAFPRVK